MNWETGEAPEGWSLRRLGDVAKVVGGGTPKASIAGNFSDANGHPWITPADLSGHTRKHINHGRRFLTDAGLAASSAKYVPAGSVLFSTRAPIGYVAIAEQPVTTNQGFRSFIPNGEVDSEYLYYALRFLTPLAEQLASGTTFAELSGGKAGTLPIAYPSLGEQREIVRKLDVATDKNRGAVAHIARARHLVAQFHLAILAAACSGRLTAAWREEHPAATADELIEVLLSKRATASKKPVTPPGETELPDIPSSWRWASVDSLAGAVVDGVHKTPTYVPEGVPFLTVRNLTAGNAISFENCRYITDEDHRAFTARTKPQRGDLLISKDGTIGVTRAVRTDREFSIFVSVALVKPLMSDMTDYLELAFQSPQVQRQMTGIGSGLTHLVLRELKADAIPVPPLAEQVEIARMVARLRTVADELAAHLVSADAAARQSMVAVMAKAFRGELPSTNGGAGE